MADDLKNVISQSMECPICLSTFTDPKIMSCSHTFCKTCLDNLLECHGNYQIRCPVCRAVTQVPNQDVGKLQVNLALKNLIEDMKCHPQICTNCKSNDKPHAVVYCQDCERYLCAICLKKHSQWEGFVGHEVIAMSDISSGKVSVRKYRKCRKHPKEDDDYFCSNCRRFTCFRCGVMEHKDEGHQVIETSAYEDEHMKSIENYKSKADKKRSCFQKYIDFIDKQRKSVDNAKKQCTNDINKAYDKVVQQLTEEKIVLLAEVNERTEGADKELENLKTSAQKHINQLTTIADMVTNRTKIPLDPDTLAAHDTLCEELRKAFDQEDPDYEQPRKSSNKGKSVTFERNVGKGELVLGKIANVLEQKVVASPSANMSALVRMPTTNPSTVATGQLPPENYPQRQVPSFHFNPFDHQYEPLTSVPQGQFPLDNDDKEDCNDENDGDDYNDHGDDNNLSNNSTWSIYRPRTLSRGQVGSKDNNDNDPMAKFTDWSVQRYTDSCTDWWPTPRKKSGKKNKKGKRWHRIIF